MYLFQKKNKFKNFTFQICSFYFFILPDLILSNRKNKNFVNLSVNSQVNLASFIFCYFASGLRLFLYIAISIQTYDYIKPLLWLYVKCGPTAEVVVEAAARIVIATVRSWSERAIEAVMATMTSTKAGVVGLTCTFI